MQVTGEKKRGVWARLLFWYKNARPVSLPQSLLPALAAYVLAAGEDGFAPWTGLLAVLGAELAHLSLNLFDDYFDYKKQASGFRVDLVKKGERARTAKCAYITSGEATLSELLAVCLGFGGAAALCGFLVFLTAGWPIIWPAALGLLLGIEYSGEPLRLSYRGFGELTIGVIFGPLLVCGVYLAAGGAYFWRALALGLALGLLVTNIVYTHSVLDIKADTFTGKRTLAALLQTPKYQLAGTAAFSFLPYLLVGLAVLAWELSPCWLLTWLTLPWAVALYGSVRQFLHQPGVRPQRLFWYGPMGDWPAYCAAGLDWFLLRWFLARNLLSAFSVLCLLAGLLS